VHDIDGDYAGVITVIDQHFHEDVICTLYSRTREGHLLDESTPRRSAGTSTVPQKLFTEQVEGVANGYAFLSCPVPGMYNGEASGIVSYEVTDQ
jgi:hypothetical protein